MTRSRKSFGPIYDAMVQFFKDDDWASVQIEGEPIQQLGFSGKNGNWTCYAHALDDAQRFIFLSIMESHVPEGKRQAVAEFLTRVNYNAFLGNLEMDFSDGEVRYKTSIDVDDGELTQGMIKTMVYVNVMSMDRYLPGIMSIIYAGTAPVDALAHVEQQEQ
jgi:hypothetical protein